MPLASSDDALCRAHDVALLDLDGVVYVGPDAVPGARESLASAADAGMRVGYLTNNASRPPAAVAAHLRELGMPVTGDDAVITSAQAVARLIRDDIGSGGTVLVAGGEGLVHCLEEVGLRTTRELSDSVGAVVQGFSPDLAWSDLAEVSYALHAGLPWYASNTDSTFPTARGTAPGNGSLVQAVANATRRWPIVAGKPERALFEESLTRLAPQAPLMVGDRIDTDIEGAISAGIPSLAVLTGVSTLQDLAEAPVGSRPDFVAPDLAALLVAHPRLDLTEDRSTCGRATVRRDGEELVLETAGEPLHVVRAALSLAWSIADESGHVPRVPGLGTMR